MGLCARSRTRDTGACQRPHHAQTLFFPYHRPNITAGALSRPICNPQNSHRRSPLALPQYVPMRRVHVDRGYLRESVIPFRSPHPRPICNPQNSRRRMHARLHLTTPRRLCRIPSPVRFFRRLSLARPNHPRASQHGTHRTTPSDFGCARVRAVRSTGLVCLSLANVGLARPLARAQAQGA
jgi:hypothetical protein